VVVSPFHSEGSKGGRCPVDTVHTVPFRAILSTLCRIP
jgi:hypothetical protein